MTIGQRESLEIDVSELRSSADKISVDFAGWYLSHTEVVSWNRKSLQVLLTVSEICW